MATPSARSGPVGCDSPPMVVSAFALGFTPTRVFRTRSESALRDTSCARPAAANTRGDRGHAGNEKAPPGLRGAARETADRQNYGRQRVRASFIVRSGKGAV